MEAAASEAAARTAATEVTILVRCLDNTARSSTDLRDDVAQMLAGAARREDLRMEASNVDRGATWRIPGSLRDGYIELRYAHEGKPDTLRILPNDSTAQEVDVILEERSAAEADADDAEGMLDLMLARWSRWAGSATDATGRDIRDAQAPCEHRIAGYVQAASGTRRGTWMMASATMHRDAWAKPADPKTAADVDGLDEILTSCRNLAGDLVILECRHSSGVRKWIIEDSPSVAFDIEGEGDTMEAMRILARLRSCAVKAA